MTVSLSCQSEKEHIWAMAIGKSNSIAGGMLQWG
jgi:hypothetical protein